MGSAQCTYTRVHHLPSCRNFGLCIRIYLPLNMNKTYVNFHQNRLTSMGATPRLDISKEFEWDFPSKSTRDPWRAPCASYMEIVAIFGFPDPQNLGIGQIISHEKSFFDRLFRNHKFGFQVPSKLRGKGTKSSIFRTECTTSLVFCVLWRLHRPKKWSGHSIGHFHCIYWQFDEISFLYP